MAFVIQKIGIIGAGHMGTGIAHVFALAGLDVHLIDIDEEALTKAIAGIDHYLGRQIDKERITQAEKDAAITLISTATTYDALGDVDLVIEATTEDEEVKKSVLKAVCPLLKPDALIATNTSTISITRLAARTDRPGKFLGMHFMNPAPKMALVELIRGIATDEDAFNAVRDLVAKMGKTAVTSEDFSAFIVNRIIMPMINEAVYALYEGVASVDAIDTAMKLGTGHPMGPLQLADFMGLDHCLAVMTMLHEGMADPKYRPCPLLVKYVEAGWLGRKTGRGFYDYSGDEPMATR